MPGLQLVIMTEAAKARFRSFSLTPPGAIPAPPPPKARAGGVATMGRPPLGGYAPPTQLPKPIPMPPALVRASTGDTVSVELQKKTSDTVEAYLDMVFKALVFAQNSWRSAAMLTGVQVMGAMAQGGTLTGPPLGGLMMSQMIKPEEAWFGAASIVAKAITDGIDDAWRLWQSQCFPRGQAWYPTFAAHPGPMAPPTPNAPQLLQSLVPGQGPLLDEAYVRNAIGSRMSRLVTFGEPLAAAVAAGFVAGMSLWLGTQVITNVFGQGHVVGFAPPHAIIGQVQGTAQGMPFQA